MVGLKKILMGKVRVLIVAAGRGTRSGLDYPKTLFPIKGKPILVRIIESLSFYDSKPVIVVSPSGLDPIKNCLSEYGLQAKLAIQPNPNGMGDAVLCAEKYMDAENVLLIWGDIPFIQPRTVESLIKNHFKSNSSFTFITRIVDCAYTMVIRNQKGGVSNVIESREKNIIKPSAGERDIGLFVFKKTVVMNMLRKELSGKWGGVTGEHGFLYIISHLVLKKIGVTALPLATELDLVSFNSMNDIEKYLENCE